MTTGKTLAILGMGPSAVSQVPGYFWQNKKTSEEWLLALSSEKWTLHRGMKLSADDLIRQELIHELYCYGELNWKEMSKRFDFDAGTYFESEIRSLVPLEFEGLLTIDGEGIALSPVLGRLLVRLIAARFDRYLQEETASTQSIRFSQLG
jgi:oxygen-independent coproporphyrinogen-3 oxidase